MSRYFVRHSCGKITRATKVSSFDIDDDCPMIPNIEVPEHEEAFTGLLDCRGDEIWRAPRPVGFGRDGEW